MTDLARAVAAYERARLVLYSALRCGASHRLCELLCAHVQAARERVMRLEMGVRV